MELAVNYSPEAEDSSSRAIDAHDCGLVLGLAHARLAARSLGMQARDAASRGKVRLQGLFDGVLTSIGDLGWNCAQDQGRRTLDENLHHVWTAFNEIVPEGPDPERVIRDHAEGGYDIVSATSFGYMDSVREVAKDRPDALFEHCRGYETADNVAVHAGRGCQGWYLVGITAGRMTESNVLGYVAPYRIPVIVWNLCAVTLGARSVNPEVELHPVWTTDWFSPPSERKAAQALLDRGAGVIARESDSTEPDKLADESGVFAIGYNAISQKVAPDA